MHDLLLMAFSALFAALPLILVGTIVDPPDNPADAHKMIKVCLFFGALTGIIGSNMLIDTKLVTGWPIILVAGPSVELFFTLAFVIPCAIYSVATWGYSALLECLAKYGKSRKQRQSSP